MRQWIMSKGVSLLCVATSVVLLAVLATAVPARAVVFDRIVAVVGNYAITWADLRHAMEDEFAAQLKKVPEHERANALAKAESEYLQGLIVRRLQIEKAKSLNIQATQADINASLEDIRARYNLDKKEFKIVIGREGLDWDRYRQMIGDQISIRRVIDREVRSMIHEPGSLEGVSARYKVRMVLFALKPGENADAAKTRAEAFNSALKAGKSFEELEVKYSDAPAGTIDIEESQMSSELKSTLQGMTPQQVSSPFLTDKGLMVVKLYERRDPRDLERERLFNDRYSRWVKELVGNAYIDVRL